MNKNHIEKLRIIRELDYINLRKKRLRNSYLKLDLYYSFLLERLNNVGGDVIKYEKKRY